LPGDKILSVDEKPVPSWIDLAETVRKSGGKEMTFVLERKDSASGETSTLEKKILGRADSMELNVLDGTYEKDPSARPYRIGIAQGSTSTPIPLSDAISVGWYHCWSVVTLTGKMLGAMFQGAIAPSQALGGPVAVFAGAAQSAAQGPESIIGFMILLSVSLALFNLLPIPILDGGHLLFFLIEAVKGSPVHVRWLAIANQVGLAFLLMLMLFAVSNDLLRIFS
jgi:regulator of sigma E protease